MSDKTRNAMQAVLDRAARQAPASSELAAGAEVMRASEPEARLVGQPRRMVPFRPS